MRLLLFYFFLLSICGSFLADSSGQDTVVTYKESLEDFPNPERGFYHALGSRAGRHDLLMLEKLKALLMPVTVRGASYSVVSSLILREYSLDSFVHASLSVEFLADLEKDFA